MVIDTKYSLRDRVWKIWKNTKKVFYDCPTCEGTGKIQIRDMEPRSCPDCWGKPCFRFEKLKWAVVGEMTIGQIQVTIESRKEKKVRYMCEETGIGGGTLHPEDTLFTSEALAEAECVRRNKEDELRV